MKKLYLIRHGETDFNKAKVYYGATDCPLNSNGRKDGEKLAKSFEKIPIDFIYTSPLIRASETANIIFRGKDIPTQEDDRIKEMNFGIWEGKYYKDLEGDPIYNEWMENWEDTAPPNGESYNQLAIRVEAFYEDLLKTKSENVAVVCHNAVLMLLLPAILSLTRTQGWHFCFEHGKYTYIDFADDFPVLKGLNIK
ncbi:MAG: alpha-ribazole phosphatase [Clostridiales bacterium]